MQPAVFLDRDNTLIENDGDLGDPTQVKLIQGVAAAVGSLRGLGYKVIVVSNQGGVARGKYTEKDVDAVHERINTLVRQFASGAYIDRFYYCPYHPEGGVEAYKREHSWRKPQPGMLLQAAKDMDLDLTQSWMIGDQPRDVEAGAAAGVRTILLSSARDRARSTDCSPHFTARSLVEAVRIMAQQRKPETFEDIDVDEPGSTRWTAAAATMTVRQHTEPAAQRTRAAASSLSANPVKATPREPTRPFRPLNLPAANDDVKLSKQPVNHKNDDVEKQVESVEDAAPQTAESKTTEVPTPSQRLIRSRPVIVNASSTAETSNETSVQSQPSIAAASPDDAQAPAPSVSPSTSTRRFSDDSDALLRQILNQLRHQHTAIKEWSWLGYVAVVLELLAMLCLLAGLTIGDSDLTGLFKWLGTGVLVQLAVVAILLFDRQ